MQHAIRRMGVLREVEDEELLVAGETMGVQFWPFTSFVWLIGLLRGREYERGKGAQ